MKITRMELENFGKFDQSTIHFETGINILYGPNEAGKTTLKEAFQAALFGFGKAPKTYAFRGWDSDRLRIHAEMVNDDGDSYEVERTLAKSADGRMLRGVVSETLGNAALPELHHLNSGLYGQIYALSTANTSEFQHLDWTGMIRNMLQTSGTELLVPTEEVLTTLEEAGNRLIRLNGRGNYALKTLEAEGQDLEERRRELLRQREEMSDHILRERVLASRLSEIEKEKAELKAALFEMEAFMTPWMMIGTSTVSTGTRTSLTKVYQNPPHVIKLMDRALEKIQLENQKNQELKSAWKRVGDEWCSLMGGQSEPSLDDLKWLSSDLGEQGIMLSKDGRHYKEKNKGVPQIRMTAGVFLIICGLAGSAYSLNSESAMLTPLAVVVMALGLWFALEGALLLGGNYKHQREVIGKLKGVFDDRLPKTAVDTLDEVYFDRLNRLSKECVSLCEQVAIGEHISQSVQDDLAELDAMSEHRVRHQSSMLHEQRELLQQDIVKMEQSEQEEQRLQSALAKAEAETGLTMEKILEQLSARGASSLPQCVERLRLNRDELNKNEMSLRTEQSGLLKEIELRSQLEELPSVEAGIRVNKEDITALKLSRDKLSVLELYIRKLEGDYNKAHQPELIRKASESFKRMSGNRYEQLYLEERGISKANQAIDEGLQVETDGGVRRLAQLTSTGTREQLYMALKLAIANQMEVGRERLPLMLDEVFAHWDGDRTDECLEMLVQEAENRQIVLFTCHKHLAERVAQKTGGRLLEL